MLSRKRLLISAAALLLAGVLIILFSPVLLSSGIKSWLWWKTRGTDVTITVDSIATPFLRPIVLRGVRLRTGSDAKARIDAGASRVVVGLNLQAILLRTRGRALRALQTEGVRIELHRNRAGKPFSE